ncbi:unnamed protein product [Fraxinus pennsylvanica]|uniref:NYN domain-containing protein n=1 Tax=Fraxinus pennsylvanica TaxID=56036 RepID=A0AAD2AHJ9_9LAMI|nr:unnamed protein product [Fraxinus pennsylvanica]
MLSAYGDFSSSPMRLTEAYNRTGVNLVHVPNGRKDAADKAILVDMFLFALDYRRPATILLISGDIDFEPALHTLRHQGYTIIVAIKPIWHQVSIKQNGTIENEKPRLVPTLKETEDGPKKCEFYIVVSHENKVKNLQMQK